MAKFFDKWLGTIIVVVALLMFTVGAIAIFVTAAERDRLYDRCIADGHAEYVCYGYVHGGGR